MITNQELRNFMAEQGYEKTPSECMILTERLNQLIDGTTLSMYAHCKNMTDEQLVAFAKKSNMTIEKARSIREMTEFCGLIKFGQLDKE